MSLPTLSDNARGAIGVLVLALVAAALVLAAVTQDSGAQDDAAGGATISSTGDYRINAIFDTAKGIIPGQVLKIAGARAGTVDDVTLTDDFKARIEMTTDSRFAPFRADAACAIKPEGLISERFVDCDPGTPDARPLAEVDGVPTVPVENTTVPVAITDLFNVFTTPVRQRFTVVVASLGLGVSGRGDDFNDVLRRANPSLKLLREVLDRLARDERDLRDAVASTDAVVAELAEKPERVGDFVRSAAKVVTETGERRSELQEAIRTLPALLDEAEPSLRSFERFNRDGTPLIRDLRTVAPQVEALLAGIQPFAAAARPALRELGTTATTGITTARRAAPVVALLRTFARDAGPTGTKLADLVVNLRDRGLTENLLSFVYNAAGFTSRYDSVGHIAPATIFLDSCSVFATSPTPGCSSNYTTTSTPAATREAPKRPAASGKGDGPAPAAAPQAAAPQAPAATPPAAPNRIELPGLPPINLPSLPGLPLLGGGREGAPDQETSRGLLDFLLG
jgi:ABC-type transporter Mla subunit MlaD